MYKHSVDIGENWYEYTMTMLQEDKIDDCELRLDDFPKYNLYEDDISFKELYEIFLHSYYSNEEFDKNFPKNAIELSGEVKKMLPDEICYITIGERNLLEQMLISDDFVILDENDTLAAGESLLLRLWCILGVVDDRPAIKIPQKLKSLIRDNINSPKSIDRSSLLFRFDATFNAIIYIAGYIPLAQVLDSFLKDVTDTDNKNNSAFAKRYIQANFDYDISDSGEILLTHPGLIDYKLISKQAINFTFEVSKESMLGAMYYLLPEENLIHEKMKSTLYESLRSEYDAEEAATDLRILIKQNIPKDKLISALKSILIVLPTSRQKSALEELFNHTPRWGKLHTQVLS